LNISYEPATLAGMRDTGFPYASNESTQMEPTQLARPDKCH